LEISISSPTQTIANLNTLQSTNSILSGKKEDSQIWAKVMMVDLRSQEDQQIQESTVFTQKVISPIPPIFGMHPGP